MVKSAQASLATDESGAVAPIIALGLFALVGTAGIAFDYARLAAMDTELQSAADQAALAAVTQLDNQSGAINRATAAARSLVVNNTSFANDGVASRGITVPTLTFYATKVDAEMDTNAVTTDAAAEFVRVTVGARRAFYALTPVVGAINSGDIAGTAIAGLASAICKVPPVMMCNPIEPDGNTNAMLDFDANSLRGAGVLLLAGNADAPGNFGFLDTGAGTGNSTPELAADLGYNSPPGDCQPIEGVDLKTGARDVVLNALNTRFDMDINGANTCPDGGTCSPSINVRKDLVRRNQCGINNQGWQESDRPYRPTSVAALPPGAATTPDVMGHPRDICHSVSESGQCQLTNGGYNQRIGDKSWDRDAYFRANYNVNYTTADWTALTGLSPYATRYEVYQWEIDQLQLGNNYLAVRNLGAGKTAHGTPVCRGSGITPGGTNVDRRRISMAVINCEALGLNGAESNVDVQKWVDVFLVEPAYVRKRGTTAITGGRDVYVEIIGETTPGRTGETAGQVIKRDVPYLVR
jgi:Flp pilus assembly protein TadG